MPRNHIYCICLLLVSLSTVIIVLYNTNDRRIAVRNDWRTSRRPMFVPTSLPEETRFPLAYSIIVYRDINQTFRLLRAIHRRCNFHCIHVDKKAPRSVWDEVKSWEHRFSNVAVPTTNIHVIHSQFSVLEADLICMRVLLQMSTRWRYLINLTGQEWPLKTNLELVRILTEMNRTNIIEKTIINPGRIPKRIGRPPHNLHIWKGAVHIVAIREFVEFALQDQRAIDFLNYLKKTRVPDESFFSTLNYNPNLKAPGGMTKKKGALQLMRLKHWADSKKPCHGKYVRTICIWGMKDLPLITDERRRELFVNKFIFDINADVLAKVEQWFWERNQRVYLNPQMINVSYYATLSNHD